MGKTTKEMEKVYEGHSLEMTDILQVRAFKVIARAIDELHAEQVTQKPASESLADKKSKALMVVIEKIIARYKNLGGSVPIKVSTLSDRMEAEIFKLFEKAKTISKAENETEFQAAIADL